jgi:hypothetical protein
MWAQCNKCRTSTIHFSGSLIAACKRCGLLNPVAIPSMKNMLISVREFNPEPLRMIVAYAVQDIGLFEPRRASGRKPDKYDQHEILQSLRQGVLKNIGDWYAAYDFYYTTYAYENIPKESFVPNQGSLRGQVATLAGQVMFRVESINTFFFELFLLFEELSYKDPTSLATSIEKLVTFVEAKTVPELCYNDDWYLMAGIVLNWFAERISVKQTYELEKAINYLRAQNAFYLSKSRRAEIVKVISHAFIEELFGT